jgi:Leu/Phe-tRNA-protein transferase
LQDKIYELTLELIKNEDYFTHTIVDNKKVNYYWSSDWSEEFYIKLAQQGFISTTYDTLSGLILLPELQFEYALLDFENLHITTKVKKLLQSDTFFLAIDENFDEVLEKLHTYHGKYNWLKDEYLLLMQKLYKNNSKHHNFKLHAIALKTKETSEIIAGEIGYTIGETYTSLSGFSSRQKRYNNCGKLQLVLLAKHLQNKGFAFWNLGHPHMEYKKRLGSKIYSRESFLNRWFEASKDKKRKDL